MWERERSRESERESVWERESERERECVGEREGKRVRGRESVGEIEREGEREGERERFFQFVCGDTAVCVVYCEGPCVRCRDFSIHSAGLILYPAT